MALTIDKLKFGDLNDIKENDDNHSGDRRRTSPITALRYATEKAFEKNTLLGISEFLGVVVSKRTIWFASHEFPGTLVRTSLLPAPKPAGSPARRTSNKLYRVYIPELEPLPAPKSYSDPVLLAYKEIPSIINEAINTGDIVKVSYQDPSSLSGPKIIEKVSTRGATWHARSSDSTADPCSLPQMRRAAVTIETIPTAQDDRSQIERLMDEAAAEAAAVNDPEILPPPTPSTMYIGLNRPHLPGGAPQRDPPLYIDPTGGMGALNRPYGFPIKDMTVIRLLPGRASYQTTAGTNPASGAPESGHRAFDMSSAGGVRSGDEIIAIEDGIVKKANNGYSESAGWYIVTEHRDSINEGMIYVRNLHMLARSNFSTGDRIFRGDILGKVGNTGNSTAAHLHFDIYKQWSPTKRFKVNPIGYYYIGDVKNTTETKTFVFEDMIEELELFGVPISADAVD